MVRKSGRAAQRAAIGVAVSAMSLKDRVAMAATWLLPVRQRSVGPAIEVLPAGLGDLADLGHLGEVQRDAEAGALVGVGLAVLPVEALGQVVDRPAAVVVFHHQRPRERRQAADQRRRR